MEHKHLLHDLTTSHLASNKERRLDDEGKMTIGVVETECCTDADGLPHGQCKTFYPNGHERLVCNFKHGELHGKFIEYDTDEGRSCRGTYNEGNLHGTIKHYTTRYNGEDEVETCLDEIKAYDNGILHGLCAVFHEGNLSSTTQYVNGKENGVYKEYCVTSETTRLEAVYEVKNGLKHGTALEYDKNAKLLREHTWVNGEMNGTTKYYDKGVMYSATDVVKDVWHGNDIYFHAESTIPRSVDTYVNGNFTGSRRTFYKNGKLKSHCSIRGHQRHGEYKVFDIRGKVRYNVIFVNNEAVLSRKHEICLEELFEYALTEDISLAPKEQIIYEE